MPDVDALVYEQAKPLSDFTLQDQNAQPVTKQTLQGQWNLSVFRLYQLPRYLPSDIS